MICAFTNSTIMWDCVTSNPYVTGAAYGVAAALLLIFLIMVNLPVWVELAKGEKE